MKLNKIYIILSIPNIKFWLKKRKMKIYLNYETTKQFIFAKYEEFKKENFEYIITVPVAELHLPIL